MLTLIDNSTLTAVQRITGDAPSLSKHSAEADVLGFENLIVGLLFYDGILSVDDYKPQFRKSREKAFPFLHQISPEIITASGLAKASLDEAKTFSPRIEGGRFTDDATASLFEQLELSVITTWDISSSVYYLTLKMLGEEGGEDFSNFSAITSEIFCELEDKRTCLSNIDGDVQLFDRNGKRIASDYKVPGARWGAGDQGGLTPGLNAFVSALSWLAYKSIYYTTAANWYKADSSLHPVRQAFQLQYLRQKGVYDQNMAQGLLSRLSGAFRQEIDFIVNQTHPTGFEADIPLFIAWLAERTKDPRLIINEALELREADEFVEVREQLNEISNAFEDDEPAKASKKIAKITKHATSAMQLLRKRYGLPNELGLNPTKLIQVYNASTAVTELPRAPSLLSKIPLPLVVQEQLHRKGFSAIFRNLGREIGNVWRLGSTLETLKSRVELVDGGQKAYSPRIELPQYMNAHSQWKSPM
jgi:hypothetical protein